jgi:hypothetical protein
VPKIQWADLPVAVQRHLILRAAERQIATEDLIRLDQWKQSNPDAPDGPWYKDFGTFKLCGDGPYPKTFLLKGQTARGKPI